MQLRDAAYGRPIRGERVMPRPCAVTEHRHNGLHNVQDQHNTEMARTDGAENNKLKTDGGTPIPGVSRAESEAAAAVRRSDRGAFDATQPIGRCPSCGNHFEYGLGTSVKNLDPSPCCGAHGWTKVDGGTR